MNHSVCYSDDKIIIKVLKCSMQLFLENKSKIPTVDKFRVDCDNYYNINKIICVSIIKCLDSSKLSTNFLLESSSEEEFFNIIQL